MSTDHDAHPGVEYALGLIRDGMAVGLGTGRAATAFLRGLAGRVGGGLRIRGVPTSVTTAGLARELGVPLTDFEEAPHLDVTVDGADEVDPEGNLIKGYGGALVREKVVATASGRLVILVGPEKLVPVLGSRGRLPVEVIPFALGPVSRRLTALGHAPRVREHDGRPFVSDNGNLVLDCDIGPLAAPAELDAALRGIPGVVGTGLFVGFRPTVVIEDGGGVSVREAGPN